MPPAIEKIEGSDTSILFFPLPTKRIFAKAISSRTFKEGIDGPGRICKHFHLNHFAKEVCSRFWLF